MVNQLAKLGIVAIAMPRSIISITDKVASSYSSLVWLSISVLTILGLVVSNILYYPGLIREFIRGRILSSIPTIGYRVYSRSRGYSY